MSFANLVHAWFPGCTRWPVDATSSGVVPLPLRRRVVDAMHRRVARTAIIRPGVSIQGRRLSIGERTFVNSGVVLDADGDLTIGDDVHVAPRACLLTSTHALGPHERRAGPVEVAPVTVGDGAWIGAGAIVLPGATVGPGCVVAAGAVVSGELEADGLYAGIPARRVKDYAAVI
jgi:maltose O-acetyltransferase